MGAIQPGLTRGSAKSQDTPSTPPTHPNAPLRLRSPGSHPHTKIPAFPETWQPSNSSALTTSTMGMSQKGAACVCIPVRVSVLRMCLSPFLYLSLTVFLYLYCRLELVYFIIKKITFVSLPLLVSCFLLLKTKPFIIENTD